jgi:ribose/xylose/arabinose/galactoside ABC-type transport system permease subunit
LSTAEATQSSTRTESLSDRLPAAGVWLALAALVAFNLVATDNFFAQQTVTTNLSQMASIVIAGVGMTYIMATGGIDLSVGSLMSLAGATAGLLLLSGVSLFTGGLIGVLLILVAAMLAAAAFGLVNGLLVGRLGIQPIVATLVLLIAGRGIAQLVTNGRLFPITNPDLLWLGRGTVLGFSSQAWIMLFVVAAAVWVARATVFGRQVVAVGGNERAAGLAGVPVRRIKYAVYTIGGLLAGLAGLINASVNGTIDTANLGLGYEFAVISAVVVGGTPLTGGRPKLLGTVGGAALIQLLTFTLASHNFPRETANLIQAAVIIAAVALQRRRVV